MSRFPLLLCAVVVSGACSQAPRQAPRPPVSAPVVEAAAPTSDAPEVADPPIVREAEVDAKRLEPEVKRITAAAARDGRRVFLYFGATWCGPCRLFKHAFERGNNRKTFAKWVLVRVNVDDLPPGPALGIQFDQIPFLLKLDAQGKAAGSLGGAKLGNVTRPASVDETLERFLRS